MAQQLAPPNLLGLTLVLLAGCELFTRSDGNQRPTATISMPSPGATYRGGDTIVYGGGASDPEDGPLPPASLTWWADFHHDTHTHPFLPATSGSAGDVAVIPTVGETSDNVWYRFYLVARDADGAAETVFRDVEPRTVTLTLATVPVGLQVTLDGQPRTTPLSVTGVVGIDREIGAVSPQSAGTTIYSFTSWSDGGAATHVVSTPAAGTTYSATYMGTGADTDPPTATLTAPADQTTDLTGAMTLTATATDNVGVVGVQFQVDGQSLGPEDGVAPYQDTLPATSAYTTGVHVLRARARDAAGNVSPWSVATVTFGNNVDLPAGFSRTTYTSGLSPVTAMAFAPDGRLFVCQQNGALRVVPAGGGAPLATAFHTFSVTNSGEQGLLGVAFHPDFATNGFVYVYYTSPSPTNHNRISRVVASAADANVSTGVETILLDDLPTVPSGGNHNGGALHFSPVDGKLYVAIGEQGVPSNAPSMMSRFGKILRYNDDGTIPTDNPFFGTAIGVFRAIWALGLRNPFTFAFHPVTGRMFINDVGAGAWEEINDGIAGSDYGWPTTEGPTSDPRFRSPVYAYRHSGGLVTGFAIVGAAFYNPPVVTFPASYVGTYFFGDYVNGWLNRLDPGDGTAVYAFARIGNDLFELQVGPVGALYALARGAGTYLVYRYQTP